MIRLSVLLLTLALAGPAAWADIVINNGDAAGEGFNDTSPITPAGGNAATNLGQARLNAFRHAAMLLDATVSSPVPIQVSAQMNSLGGTTTSAVLGYASPTNVFRDFPGALAGATWYVSALADALHGSDLYPGADDITSVFNSDVDGDTVLGTYHWYYGFDEPGFSTVKFMPAVQHEIIHGLGFITFVDQTGALWGGYKDAFMLYLEHHDAIPADFPSMTDAQRAAAIIDDGNLHWIGPNVRAASSILTDGRFGDHVRMYAPNPYESGSSTSHFDISLTPDDLMEPYATNNPETILAAALLKDIGWTVTTGTPTLTQADLMLSVTQNNIGTNVFPASGDVQLTVTNQSSDTAHHATMTFILPSGFNLDAQTPSQGSCVVLSSLLRCDLGDVPGSGTATITLSLSSNTAGNYSLAFNVSSPHFDINTTDNNDSLNVTVVPPGDADLDLTLNTQMVGSNYPLTAEFEFQVSNLSAITATNTTFGTTLPSGFTVSSLTSSQGSCQVNGSQLLCDMGDLGATPQTVAVGLTGSTSGDYVLLFSTSSLNPDPDISNNSVQINLVVPQAPQSSSGGGGGMGLFLLCLLPLILRRPSAAS